MKFWLLKLLILVTLLNVGCSSSSSDPANNQKANNTFSPPNWIQGSWNDCLNVNGYGFTTNDFILMQSHGTTQTSISQQVNFFNSAGGNATITEEINSNSEYKISFTLQSNTSRFHFVKISNTKMKNILIDPNGNCPYTKQ